MTSIIIKNGRLIDPSQNIDDRKDLWIEAGRVKAVAGPGELDGAEAAEIVDAAGQWVLPGLIDMHVHLREPGHEYKETIASGTAAAAAGGFTAVVAMPNTSPALDQAEIVAGVVKRSAELGLARVWPAAAMTRGRKGEELTEYEDLKSAGAVAVTDDGAWVKDPKVMRRVLDYAGVIGLLPLSHAEDPSLAKGGAVHEGRASTRLGLPGIPAQAEIIAVERDIALAELTGRPLHLCHLSAAGSVEALRRARAKGLPVSGETAPHYLFLTDEDLGDYDVNCKMNPPLRTDRDRRALREALADGTISALATDHAPHSVLEKEVEFIDAAFGIIGLETALPLMIELVNEGLFSPSRLVELMSLNPARLLKLEGGTLAVGAAADLTLADPEVKYSLTPAQSHSLSVNSPFWGRPLTGRAAATFLAGRRVALPKPPARPIAV